MPDMEKVIRGLECCIRHGENAEVGCGRKDECPYERNGLTCWIALNRDALALLKEQKAEIRQLKLALDIAKGTCKGISVEGR